MEYTRPFLYPKQEAAFFPDVRYIFCEASTKAGKTVGAIAWILEEAFKGKQGMNYWWVAPISPQSDIAYRRIKANLTKGVFIPKDTPTPRIELINGATVWFKSGDNPDSLFGEDVYAAVVDEASRVKEESWHALRSTLTATQGKVRVIGNVKGRKNWFYRLARTAQTGAPNMLYQKITVHDAVAAGVIPESEIEDARRTLPENVFRELYLAEPGDDSGNPFGLDHIAACTIHSLSEGPAVAFGVDLAKKHDFLVVVGLDTFGRVCVLQRWQGVPWRESIRRIHDIVGEDVPALVDSTGLGDPVLEELQVGHGNFSGYHYSAASKQRLMEGLAVSIQGHEIKFPDGPMRLELDSFEYELTRTGVRYSAPEGMFDDCVNALALCREQWTTVAPGQNMIEFFKNQRRTIIQPEVAELSLGQQFTRNLMTKEEVFDNELTDLYNKTLNQYNPPANFCAQCGGPLDSKNRVSDGVMSWHPACTRVGALV